MGCRCYIAVASGALALALAGCGKQPEPANTSAEATQNASVGQLSAAPSVVASTVAVPAANVPLRPGGTTVEAPDGLTIALIYYSLAGRNPPITDWVEADYSVRNASEFDKAALRTKLTDEYKRKFVEAGKIGMFQITINSDLSEYDEKYKAFYVDTFSGSSSLSYSWSGQSYRMTFVNKDDAQTWPLSADEAARIFERNNKSRSVQVTAVLDIVGFVSGVDGGTIQTKVRSYRIDSRWNDTKLGEVNLDKSKPVPAPAQP